MTNLEKSPLPQHFLRQDRQLLMVVHGWDHRQVDSDGLGPSQHTIHHLPTNSEDEALEVPYFLLMLVREPDDHLLLLCLVALEERTEEVQSPRVDVDPHCRLVRIVFPQGQQVHGSVVTGGGVGRLQSV